MADVADLLMEIEASQNLKPEPKNLLSSQTPQLLPSLFDDEEEDNEVQLHKHTKANIEQNTKQTNPDFSSLSVRGTACVLHSPHSTDLHPDGDMLTISSLQSEKILTDTHDIRHKLASVEMQDIESTQQRLASNQEIYHKQWQEDSEWHLREEKLALIQENAAYSIHDLQHERYGDLQTQHDEPERSKSDDSQASVSMAYHVDYSVPCYLARPQSKNEHDLMEKVAKWVTDKGIGFESMIKIKQASNPKFAFLAPTHVLHAYYNFLKQRIKTPELYRSTPSAQTQTNKEEEASKPNAVSIAAHFLTYCSDDSTDSEHGEHEPAKHQEDKKLIADTDLHEKHQKRSKSKSRSDSYSRSRSRSRSEAKPASRSCSRSRSRSQSLSRRGSGNRSPTPTPIKRSGKNSKRRKALERQQRYKENERRRRYSRSRYRYGRRRRSRSRTRSRSRSLSRSRSRSVSSVSSTTSSTNSHSHSRNDWRARRVRRNRSRSRSRSQSRDRYRGRQRSRSGSREKRRRRDRDRRLYTRTSSRKYRYY